MRLEGGLVYIDDQSGDVTLRRVLSIHNLIANHAAAKRVIDEWQRSGAEIIKFPEDHQAASS
jgi:hypothetical protein